MNELTPALRRSLRARAHHLQPAVLVGDAGLTPAVLHEIDAALKSHELVKVRVPGEARPARAEMLEIVCRKLGAAPVQQIGRILVLFRPRPEPPETPRKPPARRARMPRRTKRSYQM